MYTRLIEAGKRLMQVIYHNEGGANKDLAKFISQINSPLRQMGSLNKEKGEGISALSFL